MNRCSRGGWKKKRTPRGDRADSVNRSLAPDRRAGREVACERKGDGKAIPSPRNAGIYSSRHGKFASKNVGRCVNCPMNNACSFTGARRWAIRIFVLGTCGVAQSVHGQSAVKEAREFLPAPFDRYCERRVAELSRPDWQNDITAETWPAIQARMRKQLQGMLGLDPWPAREELHPVITGTVPGDGYVVEKLHFQSRPGLYVTANFYRPTEVKEPLPAILYVCGHSNVVENGVSMGNKTDYQHHGIWFARHGYVCLILDTIQLGEIRGFHHGTYNLDRWWWPARGYTPAGVEAWNGIRALDYLETRSEVDRARIGITGRSGGGAYSWWIAALDDRIKVAVPVAGITTLRNHVIDGTIEGHCDCMFMLNTERWDFDRVAALVAPRPLLICNSDKDEIFPLDGVMQIYNRVRTLYRKLGKEEQIGIHIAEGPHKDIQPLNIGAFHWMNRFLKGMDRMDLIDEPARKMHAPRDLKVFAELPADEKVTTVDEFFVPAFVPAKDIPSASEWAEQRDAWRVALRRDCFRAWPADQATANATSQSGVTANGVHLVRAEFISEEPFHLPLWVLHRDGLRPDQVEGVVLRVLDEDGWERFRALGAAGFPALFPGAQPNPDSFAEERDALSKSNRAVAYTCPRGIGPTGWTNLSERKRTQLRRRLLLLGESLESGQVWDICQAAAALRHLPGFATTPLVLDAQKTMAANALNASLFVPDVSRLDLHDLSPSYHAGPIYLNVLRILDVPQTVAMASERSTVRLYGGSPEVWSYAQMIGDKLHFGSDRVQIRERLGGGVPGAR
jgi:dienelactone hydrolase